MLPETPRQHSRLRNVVLASKIPRSFSGNIPEAKTTFQAPEQHSSFRNAVPGSKSVIIPEQHSSLQNAVIILKMPV
jgi:hypothetical protein